MKRILVASVAAALACAAAPPKPRVEPSEMSAAGHEEEAAREEKVAAWHAAHYDPSAGQPGPACLGADGRGLAAGSPCWSSLANPTAEHLRVAQEHREHAAQHRAASQALRQAEARDCVTVSEYDRDTSPFDHRQDILRVEDYWEAGAEGRPRTELGATVIFRAVPGMSVDWLQRIVNCHLARNAIIGGEVPWMPGCPLALKNVRAQVSRTWNGFAVAIRSDDAATVAEIRKRAHALMAP